MRGLIQFSHCHFYGVVAVSGPGTAEKEAVVCQAVIDTSGSKSIIDADLAAQYDLEVHVRDAGYF